MIFWAILGALCIVPSVFYMGLRYYRKERNIKHVDTKLTKLLDWPLVVTGVMFLIPGQIWIDLAIGFVAMAAYEGWKWIRAKRETAEIELAGAKSAAVTEKGDAA